MVLLGALVLNTAPWPADSEGKQASGASKVDFTRWLQKQSYERFDYGEDGELKAHQLIQFGELMPRETGCILPVRVISYEVGDRSSIKNDVELSLDVECTNPHLVANVLSFVGDSEKQQLEARVIGDELAYPEAPTDGMRLPDLHYTAKVKRGFLAILGTKVTVSVSDRAVRISRPRISEEPELRTYGIHSHIGVKMFILGLRVGKAGFSSQLVIDPTQGPIEEILERDDGARTVIQSVSLNPV
jgi:hypothetical protein